MTWNEYFFNLVDFVAQKSKDPSTKVGCIIVGPDNEVRAMGYNGFPRFVREDREDRWERPEKYLWVEHAERNAIYSAALVGTPLKECTIYLAWYPCANCARAIIQAGIKEVKIDGRKYDPEKISSKDERWLEDFRVAKEMFEEADIEVHII